MGLFGLFKTKKHDFPEGEKSSVERKRQSIILLKKLNIPFIEHLPLIEEEEDTTFRSPQEIAERILCLFYLNIYIDNPREKERIIAFLKENKLWDSVSAREKDLIKQESLTDQNIIDISWRTEPIWVLLWCIQKNEKIDLPQEDMLAHPEDVIDLLPQCFTSPEAFIRDAEIKDNSRILDLLDFTYRIHWATREARLKNKKAPCNLNNSAIVERHYALNWVSQYAENWDDISTDT